MILDQIGKKTGTDKSSKHHNYLHHYEQHLTEYRHEPITFIECGIGGYEYKDRGGQSLRMWREWFSCAKVVGFDLYDKSGINIEGVEIYQGSQDDREFLTAMINVVGRPTVFIDDGSHHCDLTLKTFEIVFPALKSKGWYVLEDVETSYYPEDWAGGTSDCNDFNFRNQVNLGRRLMNDINCKYITNYNRKYEVAEIHCYSNIIFIKKA
jgi:hypothetical protein